MFIYNKLYPALLIALFCAGPLHAQQDSVEWFPDFWVRSWKPAYWANLQLNLLSSSPNSSLDSHDALWRLFPGSRLKEYYDVNTDDVAAWSCPECPKRKLDLTAFIEEGQDEKGGAFPFERNFTEVIGYYAFTNQKKEDFCLVSFSTGEDYPGSGGWTYGVLGLAKFQREEGFWVLKSFNPAVDANGDYMKASAPDTVFQIGNTEIYGLHGQYHSGPPIEDYWPIFNYWSLYALVDNVFVPVLKLDDTDCYSVGLPSAKGPAWTSNLRFMPHLTKGLPDILYHQSGRMEFEGGHTKDEFVFTALPELKQYVKKGRSFDFELEKRFVFDGRWYVLKDNSVKINP